MQPSRIIDRRLFGCYVLHHSDAYGDAEGNTMKAITLRNLPPQLDRTIRERAKKKGVSVNKVVIGLLQDHLGESERKTVRRYHDLDDLSGSWTRQQAEAFDRALEKQRGIDLEMWK
jgi:plasmid stability protein